MSKKGQSVAKDIKPMKVESEKKRMRLMREFLDAYLERIDAEGWDSVAKEFHLMGGNGKTGDEFASVSFLPGIDCINCGECWRLCYDFRNDCVWTTVIKSRALASALHRKDAKRFWQLVGKLLSALPIDIALRINVGGDLNDDDFALIDELVAKGNPTHMILFFTKNYKGINAWLDSIGGLEGKSENMHPIISGWPGMECENKYNLPMSHVLFVGGTTDKMCPEFGAYYCGGDCTECKHKKEGCLFLKCGEHVIFLAH